MSFTRSSLIEVFTKKAKDFVSLDFLACDESEQTTRALIVNAAPTAVKTKKEGTVDTYAVAYNIGGATLAISKMEADNAGYTIGKQVDATLISLKMAF